MATRKVLLEEDTTALKPNNFISDEVRNVGQGRDRLLLTEHGAFFKEGFVLKDDQNQVVDSEAYMFCDLYEEATLKSGKEVWNSIVILDTSVSEDLTVTYHAYGGAFSVNARLLLEWVEEKLAEVVAPIDWNNLTDVPVEFEPGFHNHLWRDVYSFNHIKVPLDNIENAIRTEDSYYFNNIIATIKSMLGAAELKAEDMARFFAVKAVSDLTVKINKQTLDIHLLANLPIATAAEMGEIGKSTFDAVNLGEDKYIDKKGLIAFTEALRKRSVSKELTNLGLDTVKIKESRRGSVISLSNGALTTLESKKAIIDAGNSYEENVYPKNYPEEDRFTVLRVTNNLTDHGGIFLGFNNNTGEMFSGVLKSDCCSKRIKWYRYYSDITYDSIKNDLDNHLKAKNNPHKLTKKQVKLENVVNLPVATAEQILGEEPSDSYITLDGLSLFMTKHLMNLKAEFNEDGSLNKDKDLFNKPNIIFTPCDKKIPGNFPPKGQMLKSYCDGSDKMQRIADGSGGFTDTVMQLDSDDCKYFQIRPQGEVLNTHCLNGDRVATIADGRGGTSLVVTIVKDVTCGSVANPERGTVLNERCDGLNKVKILADGEGGTYETMGEVNSPSCGYTPPYYPPPPVPPPPPPPPSYPPAGTILSQTCYGLGLLKVIIANGSGGSYTDDIRDNTKCQNYPSSYTNVRPSPSNGGIGSTNN